MSLAIEGRIRAMGYVGFAAIGTPAWIGDHPGFIDAIGDGGAGVFTVTLDAANTPGAQLVAFATPVGQVGFASMAAAPTNMRALVVNTMSATAAPADNIPVALMLVEIPNQA